MLSVDAAWMDVLGLWLFACLCECLYVLVCVCVFVCGVKHSSFIKIGFQPNAETTELEGYYKTSIMAEGLCV